jgi:RNA polymerase sigma factor (sigma-70 family)
MRRRRAGPRPGDDLAPAGSEDQLTQMLIDARTEPSVLGDFFTFLYPTVRRSIAKVALCPEIAADLAAETFAVVVRDLYRFDPAKGTAGGWVAGIARNQLRTWVRRGVVDARARQRLHIVTPRYTETDEATVHSMVDDAAARAAARAALRTLSDADQQVINLRVVDRLPYGEVADALGCSEGAARVRSSRALARLRAAVDEDRPRAAGWA